VQQCIPKLRNCKQTSSRPSPEGEGHPITALSNLKLPIHYALNGDHRHYDDVVVNQFIKERKYRSPPEGATVCTQVGE
jgi:hypothetical protein